MSGIILAPVGFLLATGLVAALGVIYAALVISARTEEIIRRHAETDDIPASAADAIENSILLNAGRAGQVSA